MKHSPENIASLLQESAHHFAERPAICLGDQIVYDYRALAERAARIAGGLRREPSLQPGDSVCVISTSSVELLPLLFGIWHAGLVAVPIDGALPGEEIAWMAASSQSRLAFIAPGLSEALAPALASIEGLARMITIGSAEHERLSRSRPAPVAQLATGAEAPAWILFTSAGDRPRRRAWRR